MQQQKIYEETILNERQDHTDMLALSNSGPNFLAGGLVKRFQNPRALLPLMKEMSQDKLEKGNGMANEDKRNI